MELKYSGWEDIILKDLYVAHSKANAAVAKQQAIQNKETDFPQNAQSVTSFSSLHKEIMMMKNNSTGTTTTTEMVNTIYNTIHT